MKRKERCFENDHRSLLGSSRGQTNTLNSTVGILSWLFLAGRSLHILRETAETNQRIAAGEAFGLLENARLGTLDDLEKLGMPEPGGFHIGFFEGHEINLHADWHVCIMGMAGYYKTTSLTAVNGIRLLLGHRMELGKSQLSCSTGRLANSRGP